MVALGYAIGPLIGGVISQKVSWRVRILKQLTLFETFTTSYILVVFLDQPPHVLLRYMCSHICIAIEACAWRYTTVQYYFRSVTMSSNFPFDRKLLAVDYFGAGLTLVGCTLIILPLIWASIIYAIAQHPN